MARHESDREDLIREATALVRRAELILPQAPEPVVAGFRANGWFSVYFGQDPAFTFDAAGRLRRSFCGGFLYRTQGTTIARLDRRWTADATELVRHDLAPDELAEFLAAMRRRLEALLTGLDHRDAQIARCVGEEAILRDEIQAALERVLGQSQPLAPPLPGRH